MHVPPWDALLEQSHLKSRRVISYLITLPGLGEMCAPHWSQKNVCCTPTTSAAAATGRQRGAVTRERSREAKERARQAGKKRGRMALRSAFYKLRAKGGVMTRSDAPSSESCSPIGTWPRPARLLGPEAVSFTHLARHGPALHRTPSSGDWSKVASVPHAHSGHPR